MDDEDTSKSAGGEGSNEETSSKTERLYQEFLSKRELGENISPEEYIHKYPELEAELKALFDKYDAGRREATNLETSDTESPISDRVIGDFRIIREIGKGGMGTVYEAEQISLKRKVALKLLPPHLSFSDEAVQKFRREAEAGGRQSHPGIVAIIAVGEHEGVHYIAQELVGEGITITDKLEEVRKRSEQPPGYFRVTAKLIAEVAAALQHAHESGVIHRDIKPSNILLTEDGNPKVTDFGLAKVEDALVLSRTGDFAGTPYYMSPEQAMARRMGIDKRTDIYSLGVTLYEMLTLKRPFDGKTSHEIFKKIVYIDPVYPHRSNPKVPYDLSTICLKAMEKLPEKRYQSMREFAEDLTRFLQGEVILAKPAGLGIRMWKCVKRNLVVSTAVSVAVLATVSFIGYELMWSIPQLRHERYKALKARDLADARYEEIMRPIDIKRLSDLRNDADALWPACPENLDGFEEWIIRATDLLNRLEEHRLILTTLQKYALPLDEEDRRKDIENHPQWNELLVLKDYKHTIINRIHSLEKEEAISNKLIKIEGDDRDSISNIETMKVELAEIDKWIIDLEKVVSERRTWKFKNNETEWHHNGLLELVLGLEALSDEKNGLLDNIRKRHNFASTIKQKSVDEHREKWDIAISSIANIDECPQYTGLKLKKQVGFVPIGRDPESGLWEFAHIQTGKIPDRDKEGKLILSKEMCLVFVLIPGGSFKMGAVKPSNETPLQSPNVDPEAVPGEAPIHLVTLKPFFLSKYEMTQGQWVRFKYPNYNRPGVIVSNDFMSLLHPKEHICWDDCVSVLSCLNLRLPSESEWEYAARAGTTTVYWTGDEKESIREKNACNIRDLCYKKNNLNVAGVEYDDWLNDGYYKAAPVGSFSANPFGLHDVMGNVEEWCQDKYTYYENKPIDGSANIKGLPIRVCRGGSWYTTVSRCRSAAREGCHPHWRNQLGVRPAYSIK